VREKAYEAFSLLEKSPPIAIGQLGHIGVLILECCGIFVGVRMGTRDEKIDMC
jgi:hypothetical protein